MAFSKSHTVTFSPTTLSDAEDATHVGEGLCAQITNLIPSPTTKNLWVCRPAAIQLTNFSGFTTPGFISCMHIIGSRVYGMLATGRNSGNDEPFVYDLATSAFVTISNVLNANTPFSPAASGAWSPPQIAQVGRYVIVTHSGFNGATNGYFGWFDVSNPSAIVWNSGNTLTTPLPAVPVWVSQFYGRAYFLVNPVAAQPAAYATDPLTLTITNSGGVQVMTFDDYLPLTCAAQLPLSNQLGGIIQSLMLFKGVNNVVQVTGDPALNTWAKNTVNVATGTNAPMTITTTPKGLAFMAPDGFRLLDFNARVSDPIGIGGQGVNAPFVNALVPSRAVCASGATMFRIDFQNGAAAGAPFQSYWYDMVRQVWSGPHTFAADQIAPYNNTFIVAPHDVPGSLWQADYVPSSISVYTENGVALQWVLTTCMLPDPGGMNLYSIGETVVNMALDPSMGTWTLAALNPNNTVYDTSGNVVVNTSSFWDAAVWDTAVWDGPSTGLEPRQVFWDKPIVTSRLQFQLSGNSAIGVKVGDMKFTMGVLDYVVPQGL